MANETRISVAEAIRHLRGELIAARQQGKDEKLRFDMEKIELELGIDFTVGAEAGGGFKLFSFLDLSAKGKLEEKSGHKLKLTMAIADADTPEQRKFSGAGADPGAAAKPGTTP
jgi:hypothetical protein